jgi:hypothetical protein
MKGRLLALAILSTASAATFAGGLFHSSQDRTSGPNARVPDNAVAVTPAAPVAVAPAPDTSASAGASTYAAPANPPVVVTEPAAVATEPMASSPVWITKIPAQSGPGTTDKLRPGYPDDANGHSAWDVGTSSAGS